MIHQIQPTGHSCLPTAFANVIGTNVKQLFEFLGHDGSEIIYPNKTYPWNVRNFHPQELIDVLEKLGWDVITIEGRPTYSPNDPLLETEVFTDQQKNERIMYYLEKYDGVLTGFNVTKKRHAVSWNKKEQKIYDPNGNKYSVILFEIERFYIIKSK